MVLLAILSAWVCYLFMIDAAKVYALLLRAAFDLYRFDIYEQLHWPLPKSPITEAEEGKILNRFLYRFDTPRYIHFSEWSKRKEQSKKNPNP